VTVERLLISSTRATRWAGIAAAFAIWALLVAPHDARAAAPEMISVTPSSPLTNEQVTFTSSADPGYTQSWDLDEDLYCDDATGPTAQWSFPTARTYTVRLCVTNGVNESFTVLHYVVVRNRPPVATLTYAPLAPLTGDSVSLTSTAADPDGPIVSQAWDLDGDGAFDDASGPIASISFPTAGNHTVRLLAIDRDGATSIVEGTITVFERAAAAIAPFPVVSMVAQIGPHGTEVKQLLVKAPAGAKVKIRCRGRGCPFRGLSRTASNRVEALASRIIRIRRFEHHLLRPGATVQIWVTKRGEIGKYTRFRIRAGKPPSRVDRCMMPGAKRPSRCPRS
jgi:PKD domain-containing protein